MNFEPYAINGCDREYLVSEYWECACEHNFIHRKSEAICPVCNAEADECADARLEDIALWAGLTREEVEELSDIAVDIMWAGIESEGCFSMIQRWGKDFLSYARVGNNLDEEWLKRE